MRDDRGDVRIGIIGYGVMGKAHAYGYRVAPLMFPLPVRPIVTTMSGRHPDAVEAAARSYGIPQAVTDWRRIVDDPDIDIVDICTPPGTHAEIAIAAAEAGKAVLCEKPLAATYADAAKAAAAVARTGTLNAIGFNYRRLPAVSLMQRMVADGDLGDVRMWRGIWLTDEFVDPAIPFDWRFDVAMGASTIADLGAHLIDMALWMVGDVERVSARSTTFTAARSSLRGDLPVTVDEASTVMLQFGNGATGTLDLARIAVCRPCDMSVEINGTEGTATFDYARLNELRVGSSRDDAGRDGLTTIRAEHASHPYAAHWWPVGQGVGYGASFANQVADLLTAWPDGPWRPDFQHGARVQAVCEAAELSAVSGCWVTVASVIGDSG